MPQNPHQLYKPPQVFDKFPEGAREKKTESAISDLQGHLAHLTRPVDLLAFEFIENLNVDWRYESDDGEVNPVLRDYTTLRDLGNAYDELFSELHKAYLESINEFRELLMDLSHRMSDIRINLGLNATGSKAIAKPADAPPLVSLTRLQEIKKQQKDSA
ncbi:hypothetical protein BGZ96_006573, partial [Linnemannia gamsii]